jgi:hypothetical protein
MRYLVRWKDGDGQTQEKDFARKSDRTKWITKQEKLDRMVKYTPEDVEDVVEQKLSVEEIIAQAPESAEQQSGVPNAVAEEIVVTEMNEPKAEPKVEKSAMAGKKVKVRLTMTAEVDYDAFKAYFGYSDDELKNYALHALVRHDALSALEEYGRNIGKMGEETITFTEAKQ